MIHIYAVSDSHKHFDRAIGEYKKRLWKNVILHLISPSKKDTIPEIVWQESEKISKLLEKQNYFTILLDIKADILSTTELYNFIEKKFHTFSDIAFIIWWAYGVADDVKKQTDMRISFSKMTFPHSMALLILLEQVYRISTIKKWMKYHH